MVIVPDKAAGSEIWTVVRGSIQVQRGVSYFIDPIPEVAQIHTLITSPHTAHGQLITTSRLISCGVVTSVTNLELILESPCRYFCLGPKYMKIGGRVKSGLIKYVIPLYGSSKIFTISVKRDVRRAFELFVVGKLFLHLKIGEIVCNYK